MRFIADNCRVGALSCLLFAFTLSCVAATVFLSTPATAHAQDEDKKPDEPPAAPKSTNPIVHFFVSIGIMFGLLFAAISVGMVALIILLVLDLRLGEAVPTAFVDDFTNMVNKRQFKQAYDLCKSDSSFLARVLTAGMGRLQYGIEDAREAMMGMIETVRSSKDSWIAYLATIGTLGPMLGLVGTVSGMVGAFRKLGETDAPKPSELAGEISHALVVTLVGVAIAVPAIFFFTFFKNRLTNISVNTTNLADDLLTQMYHNSKKPGAAGATATPDRAPSTGVQVK
jgi:biopolymer transport protein ExbB